MHRPTLRVVNHGIGTVAVYLNSGRIGTSIPMQSNCIVIPVMSTDSSTELVFRMLAEAPVAAPVTNLHTSPGWVVDVQYVNYMELITLRPAAACDD
jgi:hypothetical protein